MQQPRLEPGNDIRDRRGRRARRTIAEQSGEATRGGGRHGSPPRLIMILPFKPSKSDTHKLEVLAEQAELCSECPSSCVAFRWMLDRRRTLEEGSVHIVKHPCPVRKQRVDATSIKRIISKSGIPPNTPPLFVPGGIPPGVTIVAPQRTIFTVDDELALRRAAAGALVSWVEMFYQPAHYEAYHTLAMGTSWSDAAERWMNAPFIAFIGWHFRGVREDLAVLLNHALLTRIERALTTVVTCSVDPLLLSPRWPSDGAVVDALRSPSLTIRVSSSGVTFER